MLLQIDLHGFVTIACDFSIDIMQLGQLYDTAFCIERILCCRVFFSSAWMGEIKHVGFFAFHHNITVSSNGLIIDPFSGMFKNSFFLFSPLFKIV